MSNIIVEYLNFIGAGLYLTSGIMFFILFLRTLKTKDGVGLIFLKLLTFFMSLGSITVFTIRVLSEYGSLPLLTARAIAIVNPVALVAVALYLNFLFHNPERVIKSLDSKNISEIKEDVKEVKLDVKKVKNKIIK